MRPDGGLNPGSSVYETDALPLGHRAQHTDFWFCFSYIPLMKLSRCRIFLKTSINIRFSLNAIKIHVRTRPTETTCIRGQLS